MAPHITPIGPDGLMEKLLLKVDSIKGKLSTNQISAFSHLTSNIERVQFALGRKNKLLEEFDYVKEDFKAKSDVIATQLKEIGNTSFKKKEYRQALIQYNASVQFVVNPSLRSICLANRSAASHHLKNYEAAVLDIDAAMDDYMAEKLHIILDRKGKCLMQMQQFLKAIDSFKEAQKVVSEMDEKTAAFWSPILQKQIESCEKNTEKVDSPSEILYSSLTDIAFSHDKKIKFVPTVKKPKDDVKFAVESDLLEVQGEKVGGHGMFAKGNIAVGDILIVERPFCSILNPEYSVTHCANCLKYTERQVACRNCAAVGYCSATCEEESWNAYHRAECPYMGFLDPQWVGCIGHLALRLTLKTLRDPKHDLSEFVYHENSRNPDENFELFALALHLLKVLQSANETSRLTCEDKLNLAKVLGILLHHLMVIQCNGYSVTDMQAVNSFKHAKPIDIGLGLYTRLAMVNHSCNSSVEVGFHGNKMALMATQNIKSGKEIFVDYGVTFVADPKEDRRAMLKSNFLFECECEACANNWPLFDAVESKVPTFRCQSCASPLSMSKKVKCPNPTCKMIHNLQATVTTLQTSHEAYKAAMEVAVTGDFLRVLPDLLAHLSLMQRLIVPPWRDFLSCQATIRQCYRLLPATLPH